MERHGAGCAGPCQLPVGLGVYAQSNGKPLKRTLTITSELGEFSLAAVWRVDWQALAEWQAWQGSGWRRFRDAVDSGAGGAVGQ